ncbi:MAG: prepilin-type N-terminal cleavage/methylation domain-containing protein [Planctomycetota bacterium]
MKRQHTAFTLVEMLAVMTVLSAILGTWILTLHAMRKTGFQFTDGMDAATQRRRFAVQFRNDTHQARAATIKRVDQDEPAATVLELTCPDDRVVEYRLHADRIQRRNRSGDAIVSQESFRMAPVLEEGWSTDETRPHPLLSVYLDQGPGVGANETRTLHPVLVRAAVGVGRAPLSNSVPAVKP